MKSVLIPAVGLFALASASYAQQPASPPPQGKPSQIFMQQMDTNKDGKVSKEEFLRPQEEMFKHIDKDGDGFITETEVDDFAKEMRERMQQQPK